MLFRESFITDKGAELLARATAQGGQIVWTTAKTSNCNTDGDSASTMNHMTDIVKTEQDSYTSSGSVTNAIVLPPSANDDGSQSSAAIFCELTNETYDGLARTFGAWAKIQGDQTDVLAIVARCGTGVTPTYINPVSEGLVKAFVDFTLKVSAEQAQAVQSAEGYYATATALNTEVYAREQADARMVTTHSATSTTDGDDQTILGTKTFSSGIVANGGVSATTVSASGNATVGGTLEVTGAATMHVVNSSNHFPLTDATSDSGYFIGAINKRWLHVYARQGDFSDSLTAGSLVSHKHIPTVASTDSATGFDIGASDKRWKYVYAQYGDFNSSISTAGTLTASTVTISGADATTALTVTNGYIDIQNGGLKGLAPEHSTGTVFVPIGGIVAIWLGSWSDDSTTHQAAISATKHAGESFTPQEPIPTVLTQYPDTFAPNPYALITGGTFRLLMGALCEPSNNVLPSWALAVRTA